MSVKIVKGRYLVLSNWNCEKNKRIQEYIGTDKKKALQHLSKVLQTKINYYTNRLREAEKKLQNLEKTPI